MTLPAKKFRFDINALRAIAVLGVLLFHFKVPYVGGGFAGVDIFFVISGYLMSKIVIDGLAKSQFSLLEFYKRRALRIIPALLVLVTVVCAVSFFLYLPTDYELVTNNGMYSLLFVSNIIYSKVNYFALSSDTNMFLHTWSLSAEWQFYLLLPVALMVLNKFVKNNKNIYLVLFITASVFSFVMALYFTKSKPSISFYYLHTRAWEMLLGGIAFLCEGKIKLKFNRFFAIAGYITLLLCMVFLEETMRWPGWYTLIPTIATFIIILSNHNEFGFITNPVVQLTGKVSYSVYLWHWPVYVFAGYFALFSLPFATVLLISVSVVLGYLSYKFVESINLKHPWKLILSVGIIAGALLVINKTALNNALFNKSALQISYYRKNHEAEEARQMTVGCVVSYNDGQRTNWSNDFCYHFSDSVKNVILIGDSHSAHISEAFRDRLQKRNIHMIQASFTGCMPVLKPNVSSGCGGQVNHVYKTMIPEHKNQISAVVISANWLNARKNKKLVDEIKATVAYIKSFNIPVIVLGQSETYITAYPSIAAREAQYSASLSQNFIDQESLKIDNLLKASLGNYYIDIYEVNKTKLLKNSVPYMVDHNHFTKYGADYITDYVFSLPAVSNILK